MVGPVEVKYDGDPAKTRVADLTPYIDRKPRCVKRVTGEIALNYKARRLHRQRPPQGAAGFLKAGGGKFDCPTSPSSDNEYAAISVVPMDGEPLGSRRRSWCRWAPIPGRPIGRRAGDVPVPEQAHPGRADPPTGRPPWRIKNTDAMVTIANAGLTKARC